jgi:hypothetical protein
MTIGFVHVCFKAPLATRPSRWPQRRNPAHLNRVYVSYETLGAITWYQGTAHVMPIVDGNRAFLESSVTFDCPAEEQANCVKSLEEAMPQFLRKHAFPCPNPVQDRCSSRCGCFSPNERKSVLI